VKALNLSPDEYADSALLKEWVRGNKDEKLTKFRQHYNCQRPHSALADRTPAEFAAQHKTKGKVST